MDVPTREEFDKAIESLWQKIREQDVIIHLLKEGQSEWVSQAEACRLTGRSRAWFYERRNTDSLPIAMQPRTTDSGRIFYKRSDCVAFARKNAIVPPVLL